jgi:uridine kinase
MIGDKLIIKDKHYRAARQVLDLIVPAIKTTEVCYAITVAGESGSGKSEMAVAISEELAKMDIGAAILQQDDYFILPPRTNDLHRRRNIDWVGMGEVNLELIDQHLSLIKQGVHTLVKPLVIYEQDTIKTETIKLTGKQIVITEGTYTTALTNSDCHIFIDLTYHDTKKSRLERAREEQDHFLERVLAIEHDLISSHKTRADLIIDAEFNVGKPQVEK